MTNESPVPCNGCTECCRSGQGLFLHPDRGDDVASYRHVAIEDPGAGETTYLLESTTGGACVYLGENGCTIYERRPLLCRSFDCRKHYLMLPRGDRDNLVRLGLSSRAVFNAGKARVKSLTAAEKAECGALRREYFS